MVYWDVLHQDFCGGTRFDHSQKAEHEGFPPYSRRIMLDWVEEQLEMEARIPPGPRRLRREHFNSRPSTSPVWKHCYDRATKLSWYLMRFGV
ncbi:hypothetical protein HDK77DRAFT_480302 [Phyllosticta capitalensis]